MQTSDRFRFRPMLEGFEDRVVPAAPTGVATAGIVIDEGSVSVQAILGQRIATFLQGKLGTRVGGGECAHIASEALRAAGADFTRTEPSGTQDYIWTTDRVARLTKGNQLVGKQFRVGDIIQYNNATFSAGGSSKLAHHTQVVAAVDSRGRITQVYEQNYNGARTVQRHAVLDLTRLTGGSVSVYRAVVRMTHAGSVEYTLVNNTGMSRIVTLQIGSYSSNSTLDKANTPGSYRTGSAMFSGTSKPTLKIGNVSVVIQDGAAYELYTQSNGQVGIRKM